MIKFNDNRNDWLNQRICGVKMVYFVPSEFNGNGICVDVGANVGGFPLVNHSKFEKIYCFEPAEYSYNECVQNTKDFENVEVFKNAVSNKSGEKIKLRAYGDSNYSGNASTFEDYRWDDDNFEMVETVTIEDIYKIIDSEIIDYLKIDCEGGEYDFLMNKDLSKIGYIGIEVHIQLNEKAEELMNYFEKTHSIITKSGDGKTMHYEITYKNNKIT